ncbi:hypothetical protein AWH48_15800 [Domibacillus aminovorans]|uniref:Uncharacterized protein n=1 Tax=Domibacillus aminovorans TaxID=29332 RepID=A0A177L0L9_9BACI|nr:hypothetical protein AWH48_15800 [Domibacillus aminovorans]
MNRLLRMNNCFFSKRFSFHRNIIPYIFNFLFKKDLSTSRILHTASILNINYDFKRNGLVGYREKWNEFDFPLSAYLKLKHAVIYRNKYPSAEVMGEQSEEM